MYNFKKIEKKWQEYWEENDIYKAKDDCSLPKEYNLVEFPYPSGVGMHLGHIKAYIGMEVLSRKQRLEGKNVLFPIGFDSFGLPAENYALKMGIHPKIVTKENEANFTRQLKRAGFSFDYSRIFSTTDPEYYKWTQWIFCKLYEKGLAYRDHTYVNYCPNCKVVLANEDSQGGKCDRCDSDVIQKEKDVWFLKITAYADKLLEGLNEVNFPDRVKIEQENWIGKSTGAYVNFTVKETDDKLKVYTTRPDTLFGVTFMVVAPEHPLIDKNQDKISNMEDINNYRLEAQRKTEFERINLVKDKTGVKIDGLTAINPVNNKEIPIYISDYVMMGYGTGAIMAVPAHDERDYEFAKKFGIDIIEVIKGGNTLKEAYTGDGEIINSEFLNGIKNKKEAIEKIVKYLEEKNIGEKAVQYKMKDWAFNRQRYWGEPIPVIYCDKCGTVLVPEEELPLKLPELKEFKPGPDGESPLANATDWVNCKCPKCGGPARRETDTMPQWAGSSWYYLRYTDPHNDKELASPEKMKYWMNVDVYNGGTEHITRHLIYSRFWHRFLYDIGAVNTKEPYQRRTTIGLILGSDGQKMSKSKGNTVNPDDVIDAYGADVLRCYTLFMGDYGAEAPWNDQGVNGISRFLNRIYRLADHVVEGSNYTEKFETIINKTIKKVSEDIDNLKYNTALSELMKLVNAYYEEETITKADFRVLLVLLYPFAPHLAEELNEDKNLGEVICKSSWPKYDPKKVIDQEKEIAIQVNGKVRDTIRVPNDASKEEHEEKAFASEIIKKWTDGKEIVKVITVPGRIVNIVVK
ncbi:MAG: leucine--tRNA ligase [Bacilli bacterium]